MAKPLSYGDAVRLLGEDESRIVSLLDTLITGAMLVAAGPISGVLGWFDAKSELVRLSHRWVTGLSQRRDGMSRYGRTQRLEAAHATITVVAFFEAMEEVVREIRVADLGLTRNEMRSMTGVPASDIFLDARAPVPSPTTPHEYHRKAVSEYYRVLAVKLVSFAEALALSYATNETRRSHISDALMQVPAVALTRYEEELGRLAGEFPEIAFWAGMREHAATRDALREVGAGVAALERLLTSLAVGREPDDLRAGLHRAYAAALTRPIVESDDRPAGLEVPTLGEAYLVPLCRIATVPPSGRLSEESWWDDHPVGDDLLGFLTGHLTSSSAVRAPLLVLGQPGSGKSILTKIIAARLPATDFTSIRVPLREVAAVADVQEQIEQAIFIDTGERVTWPAMARSAGDALPVVLLDGFDELLQATGVSQSDFLIRVTTFQRREAEQERPVAVIVTSRTSVADRARVPEGTVAIRLEPFDLARVSAWQKIWNRANAQHFTGTLRPLDDTSLRRHQDLASQPLLLLLLALYDADGNALQSAADLRADQLYERLMYSFVRREIRKHRPRLSEDDLAAAIEAELRRLSVIAFAMFNRRTQWVTEADLGRDLAALPQLCGPLGGTPQEFRAGLKPAEIALGRFFFVHRAQATRDGERLGTYEFLHATFGEFLVARLVAVMLEDLVVQDAAAARSLAGRGSALDDLLHALLSSAVLATRRPIVMFMASLVSELPAESRARLRTVLFGLFRAADDPLPRRNVTEYVPVPTSVVRRCAIYSMNLLLLTLATTSEVTATDLFGPGSSDPIESWSRRALLWRSQLDSEEWAALVDTVGLHRLWLDDRREIMLSPVSSGAEAVDLAWSYDAGNEIGNLHRPVSRQFALRSHFTCDPTDDHLTQVLEAFRPLTESDEVNLIDLLQDQDDGYSSVATPIFDVLLAATSGPNYIDRHESYVTAVTHLACMPARPALRYGMILLAMLSIDTEAEALTAATVLGKLEGWGPRSLPIQIEEWHVRQWRSSIASCALAFLGRDETSDELICAAVAGRPHKLTLDMPLPEIELYARLHELGHLSTFDSNPSAVVAVADALRKLRPDLAKRLERWL